MAGDQQVVLDVRGGDGDLQRAQPRARFVDLVDRPHEPVEVDEGLGDVRRPGGLDAERVAGGHVGAGR